MEERTIVQQDFPGGGYGGGGDATRVMSAPVVGPGGYDVTQQAITITCPVCQTPNGPGERYCQDCGLMFGSTPDEVEPLPDTSQLPRLTDVAGGREFVLNPGANSVGRESADIVLADPTVSRRHAVLTLEGSQLTVEDQGSTNGTSVAGRKLTAGQRDTAMDGDTVKFGNIILTLALPGGQQRSGASVAAPIAPAIPAEERGAAVGSLTFEDGAVHPLFSGVNTLGRRSANQIVVPDAFASGKHAEITIAPDGTATLVDVGSTNGTFLNGSRLPPHSPITLADGTAFTIGKLPMTYRAEGGDAGVAEAERTMMAPPDDSPYFADEIPAAEEPL